MHRTVVGRQMAMDQTKFVATCSCGWLSNPQESQRAAQDLGDDHTNYMVRLGLDDGQCDRCDGTGHNQMRDGQLCTKCDGTGRLDDADEEEG